MKKRILEFIRKNNLSPFNNIKSNVKSNEESIYKTKDAKLIPNRLVSVLSSNFHFADTGNVFNFFVVGHISLITGNLPTV